MDALGICLIQAGMMRKTASRMCVPYWARYGNIRLVFAHMGYPFVGGRMDGAGLRCVWKNPRRHV